VARDDLDLVGLALRFPVEARRLERRLVRLGAAAGEEHRCMLSYVISMSRLASEMAGMLEEPT